MLDNREKVVLIVAGTPDRHQKKTSSWARKVDDRIYIYQESSIESISNILLKFECFEKISIIIYVRLKVNIEVHHIEDMVYNFNRKMIIFETDFNQSTSNYFYRPQGTDHTF